ncbi:MAG: NrfD/PsrC family molybdoenzyme membrane anchor subunit [Bryobacteraceae bacterium]
MAQQVMDPSAVLDAPLVLGQPTLAEVTSSVSGIVERKPPRAWYIAITVSGAFTLVLAAMLGYLVTTGVGVWGNNQPVGWAWDITNFVFWIGIGHAGTLISAILFLLRQRWRTSINRAAEAMTLFAVMCAGLYPLFHVGRPWRAYWLLPLPNADLGMWPNFKSPLLWDVFAVSTYATVSALFWYVGMIPDLATLRDRTKDKIRRFAYGLLSLGWRGSARHWRHYEMAYLLLAGLSTPLVVSVHSIVSFDFAVAVIPGWHTTIFPPYFVAGAIFSGFAMVVTLMILARKVYHLEHLVTMRHLDNMAKVMLATGMIVGYSYAVEFFTAFFSGNPFERFVFLNRATGPYAWAVWTMVLCNVVVPQIFWFQRARNSIPVLFTASILINVGMWFERFVIIVTSLHRDFLPSSWGYFRPTAVDVLTFLGSIGLFLTLFLLFVRFLPMIAMFEVKSILASSHSHREAGQ